MDAIAEMYGRWAAGDMGRDDQWGDVTAEPRGLDYTEVSAGGGQWRMAATEANGQHAARA